MKKSTKPAKSTAPATKSAAAKSAPSAKPARARVTAKRAPATKPAASPKPKAPRRSSVAPAKPKPTAAVPVPVPTATPAVVTMITALIDIGFGNTLHIRGEGAGLSWDRGLPMECVADNQWRVALGESGRPLAFKFLVNDLSWSTGTDYVVEAGTSVTLEPTF